MTSMIYTNQKSKMTKRQRAIRAELLADARVKREALSRVYSTKRTYVPTTAYRRDDNNSQYRSLDSGIGNCVKHEPTMYTGTLIKGIATMHKSNAVPVIDEQQMKDISSMRR